MTRQGGVKPVFEDLGWTICKVMNAHGQQYYVKSGMYQIPLFKGSFPRDFRKQLWYEDPWDFCLKMAKRGKIRYLPGATSVMVRVLDAQREGHLQMIEIEEPDGFGHTKKRYKYDADRLSIEYLKHWIQDDPERMKQYAYNKQTEIDLEGQPLLMEVVPGGNVQAYNKELEANFIKELQLK